MRRHAVLVLVLAVGLVSSCSITRAGAWLQAQDAFAAGDYRGAIKKADASLRYGSPSEEERANANLLKAQSYERLGQIGDAVALYTFVARNFPQTPQGYQAAFALARIAPNQATKGEHAF